MSALAVHAGKMPTDMTEGRKPHPLDALFRPRSVAVIGASEGVSATGAPKMGTAALEHLIAHGFAGDIYPVNPRGGLLQGRQAYKDLNSVPGEVDLALVVLPAEHCLAAVRDCVAKKVGAAIVFGSGFSEAGNDTLEAELRETARAGGLRLVGPNTAGFVDMGSKLVATISMIGSFRPFVPGGIAFVTQSGALGGSLLGRAMEEGVGFSHWIASGNQADLETADYLDYLVDQPEVEAIALFLEGVGDADKFLAAARSAAVAAKPIVVYKAGRSEVAAAAVASHTGALAGSARIFDGICRQFGLLRVDDVADLFSTALALSWVNGKLPRGRRIGVVSASGGVCGVAADECDQFGLEIPELPEATQQAMRAFTPEFAALRNPVDVTGQIRSFPTGYQDVVRAVLAEPCIDAVLLLITMAAEPRASFYGREIPLLAAMSDKPVFVSWVGPVSMANIGYPMLSANRVPTFKTVRQAVKAMRHACDYRAFLARRGGAR